jgi:outer membrane biosynthesis protein TonB
MAFRGQHAHARHNHEGSGLAPQGSIIMANSMRRVGRQLYVGGVPTTTKQWADMYGLGGDPYFANADEEEPELEGAEEELPIEIDMLTEDDEEEPEPEGAKEKLPDTDILTEEKDDNGKDDKQHDEHADNGKDNERHDEHDNKRHKAEHDGGADANMQKSEHAGELSTQAQQTFLFDTLI